MTKSARTLLFLTPFLGLAVARTADDDAAYLTMLNNNRAAVMQTGRGAFLHLRQTAALLPL